MPKLTKFSLQLSDKSHSDSYMGTVLLSSEFYVDLKKILRNQKLFSVKTLQDQVTQVQADGTFRYGNVLAL